MGAAQEPGTGRASAWSRHMDHLLVGRPSRRLLDISLRGGFAVPNRQELRRSLAPHAPAPAQAARRRPATRSHDAALTELASLFSQQPSAARLAQALWLTQRGQQLLLAGQLNRARARLTHALQVKPDFLPAYAALGGILRELALASGLFTCLHQALDLFETMPRHMRILDSLLPIEVCGAVVYAEWAAAYIVLGGHARAAELLDLALAAQGRARDLPQPLRDFLAEAGCLADPQMARDLALCLGRLRQSMP